ncbi:hypothetical protein P9236_01500 [Mesorhizobium sp. WSM4884]|nr:hypothetical protein [Mesorhizobium sp. WSM4884]MDG4880021.1 hypothetical protein [Mesorhizobium sp. WSM4884]
MPLGRDAFTPTEVALLCRVFDRGRSINETDADREKRASRIIAYYQTGITDETELAALSRQPLGR